MTEKNTYLDAKKLIPITIILVVVFAVLNYVQPYVLGINLAKVPPFLLVIVQAVQHFFRVTPLALAVAFGWSLWGFIRYYFGDHATEYELDKLLTTWAWYEGMLLIFVVALPEKYGVVASGIIMAIKSVFNQLKQKK